MRRCAPDAPDAPSDGAAAAGMIAEGGGNFEESRVVGAKGNNEASSSRSSSGTFLMQRTELIRRIEARIARVTMLPQENQEAFYLLRYQKGQEYKLHPGLLALLLALLLLLLDGHFSTGRVRVRAFRLAQTTFPPRRPRRRKWRAPPAASASRRLSSISTIRKRFGLAWALAWLGLARLDLTTAAVAGRRDVLCARQHPRGAAQRSGALLVGRVSKRHRRRRVVARRHARDQGRKVRGEREKERKKTRRALLVVTLFSLSPSRLSDFFAPSGFDSKRLARKSSFERAASLWAGRRGEASPFIGRWRASHDDACHSLSSGKWSSAKYSASMLRGKSKRRDDDKATRSKRRKQKMHKKKQEKTKMSTHAHDVASLGKEARERAHRIDVVLHAARCERKTTTTGNAPTRRNR